MVFCIFVSLCHLKWKDMTLMRAHRTHIASASLQEFTRIEWSQWICGKLRIPIFVFHLCGGFNENGPPQVHREWNY